MIHYRILASWDYFLRKAFQLCTYPWASFSRFPFWSITLCQEKNLVKIPWPCRASDCSIKFTIQISWINTLNQWGKYLWPWPLTFSPCSLGKKIAAQIAFALWSEARCIGCRIQVYFHSLGRDLHPSLTTRPLFSNIALYPLGASSSGFSPRGFGMFCKMSLRVIAWFQRDLGKYIIWHKIASQINEMCAKTYNRYLTKQKEDMMASI